MKKAIKLFLLVLLSIMVIFTASSCTMLEKETKNTSAVNNTSVVKEKSVYDLAVENGFSGTLQEWLSSLVSNEAYKSVYDLAVENNIFTGTLEEFIASLKGEKGDTGSTDIEDGASFAVNSVVSIYCKFTTTITSRDWWGRTQTYSNDYSSAGSGVIISDSKNEGIAYIITNYHVVYDKDANSKISDDMYIYLYGMEYDQYKIPATYVGGSMQYDIAVIKVTSDIYKNSGAYPATVGSSSSLTIGRSVIAIGNPEAEGISITSGVISVPSESIQITAADERSTNNIRVIRIDAAVNSGNSGGGLFDAQGKLIGIVNAKSVDTEIEGMCYAIPINIGYAIANKIINTCDGVTKTTVSKPTLGISIEVASSRSEYSSTTKSTSIIQQIGVSEVSTDGASYGILEVGDIINSIVYGDKEYLVTNIYSIEDLMLLANKGGTITVNITRNSENMSVNITLSNEVTIA